MEDKKNSMHRLIANENSEFAKEQMTKKREKSIEDLRNCDNYVLITTREGGGIKADMAVCSTKILTFLIVMEKMMKSLVEGPSDGC